MTTATNTSTGSAQHHTSTIQLDTFTLPAQGQKPATRHDAVAFLEDGEPDDRFAERIWVSFIQLVAPDCPHLVVTGESPANKVPVVQPLFQKLNQVQVISGDPSTKKYPISEVTKIYAPEVDPRSLQPSGSDGGAGSGSHVRRTLQEFLEIHEHPLIICIKPPRELFDLPATLLAKCVLLLYGSFNLRSLFPWKSPKGSKQDTPGIPQTEVAHWVNTSFKMVVLYESFLSVGAQNSINPENALGLYMALTDQPWWETRLKPFIHVWNEHIADKCRQNITTKHKQIEKMLANENDDPDFDPNLVMESSTYTKIEAGIARSIKVVTSIEKHPDQMVLADFALIASVLAPLVNQDTDDDDGTFEFCPGTIAFDARDFTVHTPTTTTTTTDGRVFLVKNVPFEGITGAIAGLLKKFPV